MTAVELELLDSLLSKLSDDLTRRGAPLSVRSRILEAYAAVTWRRDNP